MLHFPALVIVSLFVSATGAELTRLEPLYRSGKAVGGAISVGVNYLRFSELLQGMATEIAIARDRANSPQEKAAVAAYAEALEALADSADVWGSEIENRPLNDRTIAPRYYLRQVDMAAVKKIWIKAERLLTAADRHFQGQPTIGEQLAREARVYLEDEERAQQERTRAAAAANAEAFKARVESALAECMPMLESSNPKDVRYAMHTLASVAQGIEDPAPVALAIARHLTAADWDTRSDAAYALGGFGKAANAAIPALKAARDDKALGIRTAAQLALERIQ